MTISSEHHPQDQCWSPIPSTCYGDDEEEAGITQESGREDSGADITPPPSPSATPKAADEAEADFIMADAMASQESGRVEAEDITPPPSPEMAAQPTAADEAEELEEATPPFMLSEAAAPSAAAATSPPAARSGARSPPLAIRSTPPPGSGVQGRGTDVSEAASGLASGEAAGLCLPAAATAGVDEAVLPSTGADTAATTGGPPRSSSSAAGNDPSGGWAGANKAAIPSGAATGWPERASPAACPDLRGGWASILTEIRAGALVGLDPDLDTPPAEGGTDPAALGALLSAAGARVCTAREGHLGSGMAFVVCRPERAECWLDLGCHVLSEKSVAR